MTKKIGLTALACPVCGAPADVRPGADLYQCRFCHTSLAIDHADADPAPPPARAPVVEPPHETAPADLPHPHVARSHDTPAVDVALPDVAPSAKRARRGAGCMVFLGIVIASGIGLVVAFVGGYIGPWNGRKPLVCSGNERIFVDHVKAAYTQGIAIDASGNCTVTCTECQLSAPTVIRARENARVHLDHGSGSGDVFDETTDNASVSVDHTKTSGAKREQRRTDNPGKPPTWPESGPFVCGESGNGGVFDNVTVKVSSGAAIVASVNCQLKLSHCKIEGPIGLLLADNATVELDQCDVRATDAIVARANGNVTIEGGSFVGTDHAADLVDNASLHAHGTRLSGSKSTSGNAEVETD